MSALVAICHDTKILLNVSLGSVHCHKVLPKTWLLPRNMLVNLYLCMVGDGPDYNI